MFNPSFATFTNTNTSSINFPMFIPTHTPYPSYPPIHSHYTYPAQFVPPPITTPPKIQKPKKRTLKAVAAPFIPNPQPIRYEEPVQVVEKSNFVKYDLMEYWISNQYIKMMQSPQSADIDQFDAEHDRQMTELLILGYFRRFNLVIEAEQYSVLTVTLSLIGHISQNSELDKIIDADFELFDKLVELSSSSSPCSSSSNESLSPHFSPNGSPEITSFYASAIDVDQMVVDTQYMSSLPPSPPFLYNANSSKSQTPSISVTATPHRLLSFRPGLSSKATPSATPTPRNTSSFNFPMMAAAALSDIAQTRNNKNSKSQQTTKNNNKSQCHRPSSCRSSTSIIGREREFHGLSLPRLLKKNLSIRDLIDNHLLHKLLKDKNGSKYLQEKLKKRNNADTRQCRQLIASMISYLLNRNESILGMAKDVYDNYLVQLLFSFGSEQSHSVLLSNFVINSMLDLSENKYGCRVVQEIIKCLSPEMAIQCVEALRDQCIAADRSHSRRFRQQSELQKLLKCCNGNRVIQAMIELKLPYNHCKFVGDELESKLAEYSEDRNACRVVQSFIKIYGDKLSVCKLLTNDQHLKLSQKVHGNYVIQCIIAKNEWYSNLDAMSTFRSQLIHDVFSWKHLSYLAVHKQASNVIEECIRCAQHHQIEHLMSALCRNQASLLKKFMKHKYGNFVPKTLFIHLSEQQKEMVVDVIHNHITNLHHYHYAQYKHCSELIEECRQIKQNMDGVGVPSQVRSTRFAKN